MISWRARDIFDKELNNINSSGNVSMFVFDFIDIKKNVAYTNKAVLTTLLQNELF